MSVFFVISGFLITRLLVGEMSRSRTIDLGAFYRRRAFRIFPAYYTTLAAILIMGLLGRVAFSWRCWLSSALFLRNYAVLPEHLSNWVTAHFWSLAVEEQFYLFWPVTILAAGLARSRRVAAGLLVAAPILRVVSYFAWPSMRREFHHFTHLRLDTLMFGCLPALLFEEPRFHAALDRVFRFGIIPSLSFVFVVFGSNLLEERFGGYYLLPFGWSLQGLAIALLMLWAIRSEDSLLGRVLNARPVAYAGTLSYSLYLWQQLFFDGHSKWWSFPAILAVANASYWLVEKPFLSLRRKLERSSNRRQLLSSAESTGPM